LSQSAGSTQQEDPNLGFSATGEAAGIIDEIHPLIEF
jgi:hypothetical protein